MGRVLLVLCHLKGHAPSPCLTKGLARGCTWGRLTSCVDSKESAQCKPLCQSRGSVPARCGQSLLNLVSWFQPPSLPFPCPPMEPLISALPAQEGALWVSAGIRQERGNGGPDGSPPGCPSLFHRWENWVLGRRTLLPQVIQLDTGVDGWLTQWSVH